MSSTNNDLTQRPPRSPRVRLGGYVILPRVLDKCRAELAGKAGEYHYNCPLDQHFLTFAGVDPEALKVEVAKGLGDGEILTWITAHASTKREVQEIAQWTAFQESRSPGSNDSREFANEVVAGAGAKDREDIATWFDVLDLDDYATYGGKA